jgi:maltose alpha-D-glucosyltransferase/alpha-amylase
LSERRIKRSPLQDVAGMMDSFYHASHGVLFGLAPGVVPKPESLNALEAWARFWARTVSFGFLDAYLETPEIGGLLPPAPEHIRILIRIFLLDLAMKKLSFELANSPERTRVPLHLILGLMELS